MVWRHNLHWHRGWLYLACVIDFWTRRLIGYAMDKRMTTELITTAWKKLTIVNNRILGAFFYTDRSSQWCSHAFQNMLSESFWATLKREVMPTDKRFSSHELAKVKIVKWIMFYNGKRPCSKLGGVVPNIFYCKPLAMSWYFFKRESKVTMTAPLQSSTTSYDLCRFDYWKDYYQIHNELEMF